MRRRIADSRPTRNSLRCAMTLCAVILNAQRTRDPMPDKVLVSVENQYGDYCVDVFARADGTFGFEEYRRDPEDGAMWRSLHRYEDLAAIAVKRAPHCAVLRIFEEY